MKRIYYIFLGISLFSAVPVAAEAQDFIVGFEAVPLMEGFRQLENNNFSFGNEETRYIEAQIIASKKKNFTEVKNFYKETLNQLGWTLLNDTNSAVSFYRENDILEINKAGLSPLKINIILKNKN